MSGTAVLVPYADQSRRIIVFGGSTKKPGIWSVDPEKGGVEIRPEVGFDAFSRPCRVTFDGAPVDAVVAVGDVAVEYLGQVAALGPTLAAAMLVGLSRRVLEMTVDYAKERVQFGRPIGSFQAVQQRIADMATALKGGEALLKEVSDATQGGELPPADVASAVKGYVSRSARAIVESALQVHGGIGFTEEYVLQLYVKHGVALQSAWGDENWHGDKLAHRRLTVVVET